MAFVDQHLIEVDGSAIRVSPKGLFYEVPLKLATDSKLKLSEKPVLRDFCVFLDVEFYSTRIPYRPK